MQMCNCQNGFRIETPIRVARQVMEQSLHSLIVGDGAQQFATSHGFSIKHLKPTQPTVNAVIKLQDFTPIIILDSLFLDICTLYC